MERNSTDRDDIEQIEGLEQGGAGAAPEPKTLRTKRTLKLINFPYNQVRIWSFGDMVMFPYDQLVM
jgi:hypothetical protein